MGKLGLYLHVPFCVRKCHYCDFYSAPADKRARTSYVRALSSHLAAVGGGQTVDTVYFGGGTPTLLEPEELQSILNTVRNAYRVESDAEITVECNPVTNAKGMMEGLRRAGFNRISIGLQSANDAELRVLGRPHDHQGFLETFTAAREAGFDNISVDLMFGIPDQTVDSFSETIDRVLALSPEHISAYGLRIEPGTAFDRMKSDLALPSEDAEAEMAELVASKLVAAGYEHYEISNYAKAGKRSRHNMRYWLGEDYLGFGPGAHSYADGVRFFTASDTAAYLLAVERGDLSALRQGEQRICGKELQDEYVMLRMRLFDGIDLADFSHRFGTSFENAYGSTDRFAAAGFLQKYDGRIAFTEKGMRVSNAILSDWLDFGEEGEA